MALTLKTNHALYPNLVRLFAVDAGVLKDLVSGNTPTTQGGGGTIGAGDWGAHFAFTPGNFSPNGFKFTEYNYNSYEAPVSVFIAAHNISPGDSSGTILGHDGANENFVGPSIKDGKVSVAAGYTHLASSTADVVNLGKKSITFTRKAGDQVANGMKLYVDGSGTPVFTGGTYFASNSAKANIVGGYPGAASSGMQMVFLAIFNTELSSGQVTELHSSLTGNNAFALLEDPSVSLNVSHLTQGYSLLTATMGVDAVTLDIAHLTQARMLSNAGMTLPAAGRLTTEPLKSRFGLVLANLSNLTAHVYNLDGTLAVTKTGLTSNAVGVVTFTDNAIAVGTTYRVVLVDGAADGIDRILATS